MDVRSQKSEWRDIAPCCDAFQRKREQDSRCCPGDGNYSEIGK
jgi:hypothetical protein